MEFSLFFVLFIAYFTSYINAEGKFVYLYASILWN